MLNDELVAFLQEGVATVIGTRDAEFVPEIVRGWGVRVLPDRRTVEVLVGASAGRRTLENLRENGSLAATFASPASYQAVQLKGRDAEILVASSADLERAQHNWEQFAAEAETRGLPTSVGRNLYSTDLVKLRFLADSTFDQTPGQGAGQEI